MNVFGGPVRVYSASVRVYSVKVTFECIRRAFLFAFRPLRITMFCLPCPRQTVCKDFGEACINHVWRSGWLSGAVSGSLSGELAGCLALCRCRWISILSKKHQIPGLGLGGLRLGGTRIEVWRGMGQIWKRLEPSRAILDACGSVLDRLGSVLEAGGVLELLDRLIV